MIKELAEKQFCSDCDVSLVVEEVLDKQEKSLYIHIQTGSQSLRIQR